MKRYFSSTNFIPVHHNEGIIFVYPPVAQSGSIGQVVPSDRQAYSGSLSSSEEVTLAQVIFLPVHHNEGIIFVYPPVAPSGSRSRCVL